MEDESLFRAAKRRKHARQKAEMRDHEALGEDDVHHLGTAERDFEHSEDSNRLTVVEVLKKRRQMKARGTGVNFTRSKAFDDRQESGERTLTAIDSSAEQLKNISDRFISATGQVVDVDNHMMAYIDDQIARRHHDETQSKQASADASRFDPSDGEDVHEGEAASSSTGKLLQHPHRYQIAEVDLGPSATHFNQARTEAALARAHSGHLPVPEEDKALRRRSKPRIGRNGKPYVPRLRKRRNSEDLARDALVETVLHEHALDVYAPQEPSSSTHPNMEHADEITDDRFAEQFRQQFMDAAAERHQRHRNTAQPKTANATSTTHHGPKLGGSRSARAKMAALQAQQKEQGGGTQK